MGTESYYNAKDLVLYTMDGAELGPVQRELPEITLEAGAEIAEDMKEPMAGLCMTISISVKRPKHWNCTGRKRFIKLMMGEGVRRNNAVWLADFVCQLHMTYRKAWHIYLFNKWTVRKDDTVTG